MFSKKTILKRNQKILNMIYDSEKININTITDKTLNYLSYQIQPQGFKFKVDTSFKLPYKKGESWILTEPSVFLALFNQDFINYEKNQLVMRLVNTFNNKIEEKK